MIRLVTSYNYNTVSKNEFILVEMEKKINDTINNSSFNKKRVYSEDNDYVEAIELSILTKETKEVYIFSRNTELYNNTLTNFLNPADDKARSLLINGTRPKSKSLLFKIKDLDNASTFTEPKCFRKSNFIQLAYDDIDTHEENEFDSSEWMTILSKKYNDGVFIWYHDNNPFGKEANNSSKKNVYGSPYEISLFLFLRCNVSFISSERINLTKYIPVQKLREIAESLDSTNPQDEINEYFDKTILEKSFGLFHNFFSATTKELLSQTTRAAISQVMARNMSHNIGSHVMSKFKSNDDYKLDANKQFIPLTD